MARPVDGRRRRRRLLGLRELLLVERFEVDRREVDRRESGAPIASAMVSRA